MGKLMTKAIEKKLVANFLKNESRPDDMDLVPVVKFFGGGACTWLMTEFDPEEKVFFGLCDLGLGCPELGYVSLAELEAIRFAPFNLPVERDLYTELKMKLSEYTAIAMQKGRIVV